MVDYATLLLIIYHRLPARARSISILEVYVAEAPVSRAGMPLRTGSAATLLLPSASTARLRDRHPSLGRSQRCADRPRPTPPAVHPAPCVRAAARGQVRTWHARRCSSSPTPAQGRQVGRRRTATATGLPSCQRARRNAWLVRAIETWCAPRSRARAKTLVQQRAPPEQNRRGAGERSCRSVVQAIAKASSSSRTSAEPSANVTAATARCRRLLRTHLRRNS